MAASRRVHPFSSGSRNRHFVVAVGSLPLQTGCHNYNDRCHSAGGYGFRFVDIHTECHLHLGRGCPGEEQRVAARLREGGALQRQWIWRAWGMQDQAGAGAAALQPVSGDATSVARSKQHRPGIAVNDIHHGASDAEHLCLEY